VIKVLMQRDDLKYYKNNDGQTPLQLATQLGLDEIAALIAAHPKAMAVAPKGTRDRRADRRTPQSPCCRCQAAPDDHLGCPENRQIEPAALPDAFSEIAENEETSGNPEGCPYEGTKPTEDSFETNDPLLHPNADGLPVTEHNPRSAGIYRHSA
jgi:hypothetical protein